jgi:hypothetical protein
MHVKHALNLLASVVLINHAMVDCQAPVCSQSLLLPQQCTQAVVHTPHPHVTVIGHTD